MTFDPDGATFEVQKSSKTSSMSSKYFTINGNKNHLFNLSLNSRHIYNSPDFRVQEDHLTDMSNEYIFIAYPTYDEEDPQRAWAKGQYIVTLVKGAHNIASHNDYREANFDLVDMVNWDKEERILVNDRKAQENAYANVEPIDQSIASDLKDRSFIAYSIYMSRYNKFVRDLLLLSSHGNSYSNLYRVLDTIRHEFDKGFEAFATQSGFSTSDVKAFTGVANNYGIIGLDSRHGELGFDEPKKQMSLEDSTKMIFKLAYDAILR